MSADSEAVDDVCASCGITGGDDIKLMNAPLANSFDIAVLTVRKATDRNINEHANKRLLNCVMRLCSSSLQAVT